MADQTVRLLYAVPCLTRRNVRRGLVTPRPEVQFVWAVDGEAARQRVCADDDHRLRSRYGIIEHGVPVPD